MNWKSELLCFVIQLDEGLLPFIRSYIAAGETGLAMHFVYWSAQLHLAHSLS